MNYAHLTRHMHTPHFVLPSLFQVIRHKLWERNLYYAKIDFASAFFNIPLKEESKHITIFKYNNKFFVLNWLPMGLSKALFVMQRFLNAIATSVQHLVTRSWGHIDDLLLAHQVPIQLRIAVNHLLEKLTRVDWKINVRKSVLNPSKFIIFLGARWGPNGVLREPVVSTRLKAIWEHIVGVELTGKPYSRVAGLFNYYFLFAGCYHAVTNRILKLIDKRPYDHIIKFLLKRDYISFTTNLTEIQAWSDASLFAIAA